MASAVSLNHAPHTRLRCPENLFYLSRVMGTSLTMIDKTYWHLVPDSDEYVRGLLDAYDGSAAKEAPG